MLVKNTLATLLGLAVVADAASVHSYRSPAADGLVRRQAKFNRGGGKNNNQGNNQNNNQGNNQNNNQGNNQNNQGNNNNNNNQASVTCLAPNAIATGSQQTGQNGKAADGQVESAVDPANFINFCAGQTLTNGLQNRDGSCNGVVMGKIPSVNNMVSTIITNPKNFQVLPPNQSFTISLQVNGLNAGSFTNATSTYYSAPQDIGGNGNIIGHTHVTVQDTGNSLDPAQPLDPRQFVFFKGINDAGNGRGGLSTEVTGGLPEGFFRLCTMSSASNHQPVLMPVAQRGTQEDCKYFAVSNNPNILNNAGGGNNNNNNQGNNQNNQGKNNGQGQAQAGQGQNNQGKNNGQGQAQAGQGQNNQGKNNGQGQAQAGQGQAQAGQGQAQAGQGQAQAGQGQAQAGQGQAQAGQGKNNQQGNQQGQQDSQGKQQGNQQGGQGKANGNQGGNQQANAGGAGAAGALGGIAAPAIQNEGGSRPFVVNGNSFVNREAAVQRSCAIQNNACSNAVNSGSAQGFSVADCNAQEQACRAAA